MTKPGRTLLSVTSALLLLLLGAASVGHAQSAADLAAGLTLDRLDAARDSAIKGLYDLEPNYTFFAEEELEHHRHNFRVRNQIGNHALAVWALLAAGESYQNPVLYRRLNWILSSDVSQTYDRGMRAQMLAELPQSRWAPWIRRDAIWLGNAMATSGGFAPEYNGTKPQGFSGVENANSLYGVLGLWGVERGGNIMADQIWAAIDTYWRNAPDPESGGFAILSFADQQARAGGNTFNLRVNGPMTAGGTASLALVERFRHGHKLADVDNQMSPQLAKAIAWLDRNFVIDDPAEADDWYYYMWNIQRVGHATGYRTFNGVDWFRDGTAALLSRQEPNGTWSGPKGTLLSTGFALLYIAKAYDPLAIGKIRFQTSETVRERNAQGQFVEREVRKEGRWNNRPHDIWNFVDHASDRYEVSTSWQVVELDQPLYELMESPVLYLSTNERFELGEEQVKRLREYIDAGGMLVTNTDKADGAEPLNSFKKLSRDLFGREFERVPRDHPLFFIHEPFNAARPIMMVENGLRPLMIHFVMDIGGDLQLNKPNADSFTVMSNIYLYTIGMNPRRVRLDNNYKPLLNREPRFALKAARIRHGGEYDPEPAALSQLKNILANDHDIDLQYQPGGIAPSALNDHKIAFLTTTGAGALGANDTNALRQWIEKGGTLWVDAAGGGQQAVIKAREMVNGIMPDGVLVPLPNDDPIISARGLRDGHQNARVKYRNYTLIKGGPAFRPRLQAIMLDGRPAVIFAAEDITCGLAGLEHWGISGYSPRSARQLVVNSCLSVMAE